MTVAILTILELALLLWPSVGLVAVDTEACGFEQNDMKPSGLSLVQLKATAMNNGNDDVETMTTLVDEQNGANWVAVKGFPHPHRPRMLVSRGCSMSSYVITGAKELLKLHGMEVMPLNHSSEVTKPEVNPYFKEGEGIDVALERMHQAAMAGGYTILLKHQESPAGKARDAFPSLVKMNTYAVHSHRENVLDTVACNIRDCFPPRQVGYSVDGTTGKKTHICFEGRTTHSVRTKAKVALFNLTSLNPYLAEKIASIGEDISLTKVYFPSATSVKAEDLSMFEEDASLLQKSVDTWMRLLSGWGLEANRTLVQSHLQQYAGTRPLESQAETIYNYDEVKEMLEPGLKYLLRD